MHAPQRRTCTDAGQTIATEKQRKHILLLENDEFVASLLHLLLHRQGFDIHAFVNSETAIPFIRQQSAPDLIFMNSHWFKDDPPLLLSAFQQQSEWRSVPVILLMNYFCAQTLEQAAHYGIKDYLLQPFEPAGLLDVIKKYL